MSLIMILSIAKIRFSTIVNTKKCKSASNFLIEFTSVLRIFANVIAVLNFEQCFPNRILILAIVFFGFNSLNSVGIRRNKHSQVKRCELFKSSDIVVKSSVWMVNRDREGRVVQRVIFDLNEREKAK